MTLWYGIDMKVSELQEKTITILREYGVAHASVFGSVARGEDRSDSDVDLLVRLGKPMTLFGFVGLAQALEKVLGKKVDLVTEQSLNKHVKPYVLRELQTIYEG